MLKQCPDCFRDFPSAHTFLSKQQCLSCSVKVNKHSRRAISQAVEPKGKNCGESVKVKKVLKPTITVLAEIEDQAVSTLEQDLERNRHKLSVQVYESNYNFIDLSVIEISQKLDRLINLYYHSNK